MAASFPLKKSPFLDQPSSLVKNDWKRCHSERSEESRSDNEQLARFPGAADSSAVRQALHRTDAIAPHRPYHIRDQAWGQMGRVGEITLRGGRGVNRV